MSGLTIVLLRELHERWTVLAVAAVAALIPVLAPWLPGISGSGDVRSVTGWFVALSIAGGFGLLLGGGALARDLVEGRVSFYFSRPLGGLEIWGGKIAAAVLLTIAAAMLPLAAAFLLEALVGGVAVGDWTLGLAVVVDLAVIAVAIGHAAGVMIRSRSRWQVLDVVGLALVTAGVWWALATLQHVWAGDAFWVVIGALLVVVPAALLLAGAVQMAGGRSDPVRGHRLLSLTLWGVLGVFTAALAAGAFWLVTPGPDDLTAVQVAAAPGGSWLAASGHCWARGDLVSTFLVDADSGRWLRLPSQPWGLGLGAIAQDGRRAVWAVPTAGRRHNLQQLVLVNLELAQPEPQPTSITLLQEWHAALAISPNGKRLAIAGGGTVTVSALPGARLLVATRLPQGVKPRAVLFTAPDRLRIYGWIDTHGTAGELWIGELDVSARRLSATGSVPGLTLHHWQARLDRAGERMVFLQTNKTRTERAAYLYDARSGARLGDLTLPGWQPLGGATFLADGGVALTESNGRARRLRVAKEDGGEQIVSLPSSPKMSWLGFEAAPGTVLVGLGQTTSGWQGWRTLAVTPRQGTARDIGPGHPEQLGWPAGVLRTPPPGSLATRLLTTGSRLELLDPDLARVKVVAGRS